MRFLFRLILLIHLSCLNSAHATGDRDYKRFKPINEPKGTHYCPSTPQQTVEFEVGQDPEANVKQLLQAFHEIEHNHSHGPKTWRATAMNFLKHLHMVQSARDLQRMFHWKSFANPDLAEHGKNILFLATFTHITETALAVAVPVAVWASGASATTVAAVTAAGAAIAAPGGAELLCWAGYGIYAIPQARPGVRKMRLMTIHLAQKAYEGLKLSTVVNRLGQWRGGKEILFKDGINSVDGHFEIHQGGIHLNFNTEDSELPWLESVHTEGDQLDQDFKNIKVALDANTSQALKQLIKHHNEQKDSLPFYVKSQWQGSTNDRYYVLQPGAIRPSGRWQWNSCEQWLKSE